MGFDVAVMGEIAFPSSQKRGAWQRAQANPGDHEIEAEIMGFEVDDDPRTVKGVLTDFAQSRVTFLELENEGARFRMRAVVDNDVWGAYGSRLMAAALAASRSGGTGNLTFLGFVGIEYGVEVKVEAGDYGVRRLTEKQIERAEEALADLREAIAKRGAAKRAAKAAEVAPAIDVGPLVDRLLAKKDPSHEVSQALTRAPRGASAAIAAHLAKAAIKPSKKRDYAAVAKVLSERREPAAASSALLPLYERAEVFASDVAALREAMADAFLTLRDPPGLTLLARNLEALFEVPRPPSAEKELERAIQATLLLDPKAGFDTLAPRADRARVKSSAGKETVGTIFESMRIAVVDPAAPMMLRWLPLSPLDGRWAAVAASWLAPPVPVWLAEWAALVLSGLGDERGARWYLGQFEKLPNYFDLNVPAGIEAVSALGDPRAVEVLRKGAKRAATPTLARLFTRAAQKLEAAAK